MLYFGFTFLRYALVSFIWHLTECLQYEEKNLITRKHGLLEGSVYDILLRINKMRWLGIIPHCPWEKPQTGRYNLWVIKSVLYSIINTQPQHVWACPLRMKSSRIIRTHITSRSVQVGGFLYLAHGIISLVDEYLPPLRCDSLFFVCADLANAKVSINTDSWRLVNSVVV